jgi:hypothetical protein
MPLGQIPRADWSQIVEWLRLFVRLPIIGLLIVTAAMMSWLGFWFVVRFSMYVYTTYLNHPW